jgi:catechol 2,3-dioxygenase-like lactoylglutathione lyase family enzyme
MKFSPKALVIKLSVSDMLMTKSFYENILGFKEDARYTINTGGNFGAESYVQLELNKTLILGLYKDISTPFEPIPQTGTIPSFIVDDIEGTLACFLSKNVVIDKIDGQYIISNTSDSGYTDHFFFFRDPDNNSLVVRQNLKKISKNR